MAQSSWVMLSCNARDNQGALDFLHLHATVSEGSQLFLALAQRLVGGFEFRRQFLDAPMQRQVFHAQPPQGERAAGKYGENCRSTRRA